MVKKGLGGVGEIEGVLGWGKGDIGGLGYEVGLVDEVMGLEKVGGKGWCE